MRYIGTGEGSWRGDAYRYAPSLEDQRLAAELAAEATARAAGAGLRDQGYRGRRSASSTARGILGEVAALHPVDSGPDLDAWRGRGFRGSADLGRLEVRTTNRWQLYEGALRGRAGLCGWTVRRKDAGRILVAVLERDDDLLVLGWARADDVRPQEDPLPGLVGILEPSELHPLEELYRRRRVSLHQ